MFNEKINNLLVAGNYNAARITIANIIKTITATNLSTCADSGVSE